MDDQTSVTKPNDDFYSDDVQAQAIAENDKDDDLLVEDEEIPVTSGEMEIGDLDSDSEAGQGSEESFDEETVPGGEDNVVDPDNMDATPDQI